MPNPTGANGREVQSCPSDEVLLAAFTEYAKENGGSGLSWEHQIQRLKSEHNFTVGRTTLSKIRKRVGAPSVRKTAKSLHPADLNQRVEDLKQSDALGLWGVSQVRGRLANEGVFATRQATRNSLHDNYDDEFENRFRGKKKPKKHRTPLHALGPWHQEHSDGHEKLGEQGLMIGKGIHLPIYASKDQYAAWLHSLLLMPHVRTAQAIAHYYLDLVEGRGYRISITLIVDGGTEVVEMLKIHERLRADAAPDFTLPEWPYSVSLPSTQNTPIESFWRLKRNGEGRSIRHVLEEGANQGYFMPNDDIHKQTFYWIWVPFIQWRLDLFREYWNNHRLQDLKAKINGSGMSPKNLFLNPQAGRVDARDCSIKVRPGLVHELREAYGGMEAREKTYRFVSPNFQAAADEAYVFLGCPDINLDSIWGIFTDVVKYLDEHH
ncbi:hypothetical protein R3P38DRAFT_2947356 [Favolaschia claudopus]|uniref:Uncharacterized protein n=1 Tax=Favolaschia claudopus TaxID=2862362 RepID=A0AAW0BI49_9AGAR